MNPYISRSLAHWEKTPWSSAALEAVFRHPQSTHLVRITLQTGRIQVEAGAAPQPERIEALQAYLAHIARLNPDLNLTLYLCTADHPEMIVSDSLPFFTLAKTLDSHFILLPDQFFTRDFSRYHRSAGPLSLDADVDAASAAHPWTAKKSQAIFRSLDFKYAEICHAALALPDEVDAKIASPPEQCAETIRRLNFPELAREYPAARLCGGRMNIPQQIRYKYLLHTPACWDSTYWKLRSNSLLFSLDKMHEYSKDSDHLSTHQWYAYFMEPHRHYIPCTLDDLAEKIAWARTHDEESQQIATAGAQLAREELSYEKSLTHVGQLLRAFAALSPHRP